MVNIDIMVNFAKMNPEMGETDISVEIMNRQNFVIPILYLEV